MPLEHSSTKEAFSRNVATEIRHGKPRDQALAIAYRIKRQRKRRGGRANYADGGADDSPYSMTGALASEAAAAPLEPKEVIAMGASAADPFGVPSAIAGDIYGPAGEAWQHAKEAAPIASLAGSFLTPAGVVNLPAKGLAAAAKYGAPAAAGLAGLGLMATSDQAGGAEGKEEGKILTPNMAGMPTHTENERKEISDIQARMDKQQKTLARQLDNLPGKSNAQARQDLIANAAKLTEPMQARIDQINSGVGQRQREWQGEQTREREAKHQAEMGFAERYPTITTAAPFVGAVGGGLTGALTGRALKAGRAGEAADWAAAIDRVQKGMSRPGWTASPAGQAAIAELRQRQAMGLPGRTVGKVGTIAGAGLAGGLEGGIASAWPSIYDAETLPVGSPNQRGAAERLGNEEFWKSRVLPAAAIGVAAGGLGAKYGTMGTKIAEPEARTTGALAGADAAAARAARNPPPVFYDLPSGPRPQVRSAMAPPEEIADAPAAIGSAMRRVANNPQPQLPLLVKTKNGRYQYAPGHEKAGQFAPKTEYGEAAGGAVNDPAMSAASRVKRAFGGPSGGMPPWYVRQEARGMTGPLHGVSTGRADHLPINVPGGSYVLPADHVSALGQGNSQAGMAILNHMFGHQGPYGMGQDLAIKAGRGAPAAPRMPRLSAGGVSHDHGQPVPINASHGEFVIPPEIVMQIGNGDLKHGHDELDKWVLASRAKHIKTLRKLPPPAKS
jgi:hypothetical protein